MSQPAVATYLVTGCAGFIAARVCELLLEAGHEVLGVDNLNAAYDPRLKEWRLARLRSFPRFRFEALDISDRKSVENLFVNERERQRLCQPASRDQAPFAAVINLAARAGVRASVADPWVYYRTNCEGALNLLEACRQFGVRKYILASTSSLYGAHNPVPYDESADTDRPLSPYAASKKAAETIAYTYHHLYGTDVSVLRYFTVYGPAGRPDMSIFRFIRAIAEGEPIVVYGDGTQSRDFTYVDDIARGTILALRPVGYEVINLGGDAPAVLNDVIDTIARLVGKPVHRTTRPRHPADVPATWANIRKAREILGWQPQVPLEEGLRRTVAWYWENRDFVCSLELGPW
ncbi:MAG: GDP-mannose 4,6-dehydratase [Thermoguttaceae bacterium]|nr:GDP-mannose 4,6-dehydratase [Thermoguttaceae bacterium]MDW8077901.1 GDP-mannose 4,6-dehydratase [Thermoguttaceae bacterium]